MARAGLEGRRDVSDDALVRVRAAGFATGEIAEIVVRDDLEVLDDPRQSRRPAGDRGRSSSRRRLALAEPRGRGRLRALIGRADGPERRLERGGGGCPVAVSGHEPRRSRRSGDRAVASPSHPRSTGEGARSESELAGTDPLVAVTRSAITPPARLGRDRLRECEAADCLLFFLAGDPCRRWCSTPCGTCVRVARHLARG